MIQKMSEGRTVNYIVPMNKYIEGHQLFINVTDIIKDAINKDHHHGYEKENGPRYAIEVERVKEYVNYIDNKIDSENYSKFSTKNYYIFTGAVNNDQ